MNTQTSITVTFKTLRVFAEAANFYLIKDTKNSHTKFAYAINKIMKQSTEFENQYKQECDDLQDTYQAIDSDKCLLWDLVEGKRFPKFTAENHKIFRKKREELYQDWLKKEFTITPYMATDIPDDLTLAEIDCFLGLIIPADYNPDIKLMNKKSE